MVKLELHKMTKKYVEYKFFPEGKEDYGILRVDKKTRNGYVTKETEKYSADNYARHAYFAICDCVIKDDYPKTTGRAWY